MKHGMLEKVFNIQFVMSHFAKRARATFKSINEGYKKVEDNRFCLTLRGYPYSLKFPWEKRPRPKMNIGIPVIGGERYRVLRPDEAQYKQRWHIDHVWPGMSLAIPLMAIFIAYDQLVVCFYDIHVQGLHSFYVVFCVLCALIVCHFREEDALDITHKIFMLTTFDMLLFIRFSMFYKKKLQFPPIQ